jgi:hypothetical protein
MVHVMWADKTVCGPSKTFVGQNVSRVTAESVTSADSGDNSFDTLCCTLSVPGYNVEQANGHGIFILY